MLTLDQARQLFAYDPITGELTRLAGPRAGCIAGFDNGIGYKAIRVDGKNYLAHRVAWLLYHGKWPSDLLDHINGVRSDNRLSNLREATNAQNLTNKPAYKNNTSGFKGVYRRRDCDAWRAKIRKDGKTYSLGQFATAEEAAKAYEDAAPRFFGQFARAL